MAGGSGKVVKVQKVPTQAARELDPLEVLDEFCYYYPAYRFDQARRVPYKHVKRMLRSARRLKAAEYHNLTQISVAPHTENAEGVKNLLDKYEEAMNG